MTVPASLARPIRTGGQGGAVYAVLHLLTVFGVLRLSGEQFGALVAVGTPLAGWAQVLVENRLGHGWLRTVPRR